MIESLARSLAPLLDAPLVRQTRRNHALEHATITILSGRVRGLAMAARSDERGFILIGDAPTDKIEAAANDALRRLRSGESGLAIHPNCGTNLVTVGLLASLGAMIALFGARPRHYWDRLPSVLVLVMLALIGGQPLGLSLQRHITTDGDPSDLAIISIVRREVRTPLRAEPIITHRVTTRSS